MLYIHECLFKDVTNCLVGVMCNFDQGLKMLLMGMTSHWMLGSSNNKKSACLDYIQGQGIHSPLPTYPEWTSPLTKWQLG